MKQLRDLIKTALRRESSITERVFALLNSSRVRFGNLSRYRIPFGSPYQRHSKTICWDAGNPSSCHLSTGNSQTSRTAASCHCDASDTAATSLKYQIRYYSDAERSRMKYSCRRGKLRNLPSELCQSIGLVTRLFIAPRTSVVDLFQRRFRHVTCC